MEFGVAGSRPPSAALRVQVFVLQAWLGNLRVPAAAFPLAARDPLLMEEQPFDGPGNDAVDDGLVGHQASSTGSEMQSRGKCRRMTEPIDVLRRLAGAARIGADRRIEDEHADVWVREIEPSK